MEDIVNNIFSVLQLVEKYYWEVVGLVLVLGVGTFLSIKANLLQIKVLANIPKYIKEIVSQSDSAKRGIHPLQLIFASTGGMVGVGNVVGVSSAVLIGGPGALIWLWVGIFLGMLIKYSEIYLAITTRTHNENNSYDGGIMFYVQKAFGSNLLTMITAVAMCIYTVEIYQFNVVVDSLQMNFDDSNRTAIVLALLCLVIYSAMGGLKRITKVCSIMMPLFISVYLMVGIWIIFTHATDIPAILLDVFKSAFCGKSAVGGFIGSTFINTAYSGISKAVYAGDIGIGYDSIVQSESRANDPHKQGILSIYCIAMDAIICSVSMLIVIVTGSWQGTFMRQSDVIPQIFESCLVHGKYFMTFVLFFAGFTTVISFMTIGFKTAKFISKKYGQQIYMALAVPALFIFSYVPQEKVILIMSLCAGVLVTINLAAILKLRHQIKF